MPDDEPPPLTVVPPGGGRAGDLGSIGVVFKLWGRDTDGALAVVEHPFPVGASVPPHLHTREDEYSIVTEGRIGFRSGDREVVLDAGGYLTKPRGELHAMWNAGDVPARMIEVISPAGFEEFFAAVVDLVESGEATPEAGAELAERYGLVFGEPPWWPEVVARFALTASAPCSARGSSPPARRAALDVRRRRPLRADLFGAVVRTRKLAARSASCPRCPTSSQRSG